MRAAASHAAAEPVAQAAAASGTVTRAAREQVSHEPANAVLGAVSGPAMGEIRPLMGEIVLDGRRLETAWWGPSPDRAPTLVMLHEGLGSIALWRGVPARLAAASGCGVFAWSRFGYGQSDPVTLPRPMSYLHDEASDVMPRVLDAAGIRRALPIGHSDGGSIAAIHAGRTRDPRLLGLVLIAAHFFVEDLNVASIAQITRDYGQGDLRRRLARYHRDVDTAFHGWSGAWLDPRFRALDLTAELERIGVPVLGLQGDDDPYGSDAQLDALTRHVRAPVETRLIPGARHAPHLEAPEPTLEAIGDFVAACLRKAAA
jgi:pimeloyl-ACP methyl ester carboxylesterase